MPDITFDSLLAAQKIAVAEAPKPEGMDMSPDNLMEYAKVALGILEQFNLAKSGGALPSRPVEAQTQMNVEMQKPTIDVGQIKEALATVQGLKGDINISSLLELLEENKEMVANMLKEL